MPRIIASLVALALLVGGACSDASDGSTAPDGSDGVGLDAEPGSLGCDDAATPEAAWGDEAGVLLVGFGDEAWLLSADGQVTPLVLQAPVTAQGAVGGDGRVWAASLEAGAATAIDPATGAVEQAELPPEAYRGEPRLVSAPDGAALLMADQLIELRASPVEVRVTPVEGVGDELVEQSLRGPDGLLWAVRSDGVLALDAAGELVVSEQVAAPAFGTIAAGEGCMVYLGGRGSQLLVVDETGASVHDAGSADAGAGAIFDGVVWVPGPQVHRIDLASGEVTTTDVFECGLDARVVAGPGGVVALDPCGYEVARLDPATGAVVEERRFAEAAEAAAASGGDLWTWQQWPWAGFGDVVVLHLPSLEPIDVGVALTGPPWSIAAIAPVPPSEG